MTRTRKLSKIDRCSFHAEETMRAQAMRVIDKIGIERVFLIVFVLSLLILLGCVFLHGVPGIARYIVGVVSGWFSISMLSCLILPKIIFPRCN